MAKFKQEILDKIKSDTTLFSIVANEMGIKPVSLAASVDRNGDRLNQYSVVKVVADYLKKTPDEILEEDTVKA